MAFRLQRLDEEKEAVVEKEGGRRRGRKRRKKTKRNTKNIDLLILEP